MTDFTLNSPTSNQNFQKVCRLCLSEESLEDIFEQNDLTVWISDLLSIVVSQSDRISHWICVLCRIRIQEFREYQSRCLEVQEVLLSDSSKVEHVLKDEILIEDSLWAESITIEDDEEDEEDIYNLSLITATMPPQTKPSGVPKTSAKNMTTEIKLPVKGCYKGRHIKCDICGRTVQKLRFDNHMNGHLGIRPYKCERGCPAETFACKYKRQAHYRRVHFGYTYECTLCDKSFGTRQGLFYHKQRKHNSHECSVCHQKFETKTILRRHVAVLHKEVAIIPSSVS